MDWWIEDRIRGGARQRAPVAAATLGRCHWRLTKLTWNVVSQTSRVIRFVNSLDCCAVIDATES